jgi:hypothetical protein
MDNTLIMMSGSMYWVSGSDIPDFNTSSPHFKSIISLDTTDNSSLIITSHTASFYMSSSGQIGIGTTDPQSGFDVVADEVQFQKPGSRKGLKINNEGNIESFNKDIASAATGSEFILKYSRGTTITQASLDALGIVDGIEDDETAVDYINALRSEEQNILLEKLEFLGFINSPEVGDTLGSIRFIAESGSLAGFNSRVAGEAALIKAVVNSIDATGVQADLIFSVAGKEGASEQKLLLDANNNHELTGSLNVTNNLTIGAGIFHGGDNDTSLNFTDNAINFKVGNEILMQIIEHTQDKVLIGDGGDVDFRVVTDGQSISGTNPSLFVEGSSGNVGIGINTPTSKLHVVGDALITGKITAQEFHTNFISSSIIYQSGSTQFGNSADDTHTFTGHITSSGNISASGIITALSSNIVTINTTNLLVEDNFIIIASGSQSATDGGIIVSKQANGAGFALGYDASETKWVLQNNALVGATTLAPDAFIGIISASNALPTADPAYGGATGYGNIHVNTAEGDMWVYV